MKSDTMARGPFRADRAAGAAGGIASMQGADHDVAAEPFAGSGADAHHGQAARHFAAVYDQLRAMAVAALLRERRGHTLQATALVHEVFLRLGTQERARWKDGGHLLAVAAAVMRRVLVDHARSRIAF